MTRSRHQALHAAHELPPGSGTRDVPPTPALEVVRIPAWEKLDWLQHGFSTRMGGTTTIYRSRKSEGRDRSAKAHNHGDRDGDLKGDLTGDLNLGFTSSDTAEKVLANCRLFVEAVAGGKQHSLPRLVTLRQIHSTLMRRAECESPGLDLEGKGEQAQEKPGDGLMTDEPGLLLGIRTADCIPVLIADRRQRVVAAFHAGWRGTLGRIVEKGVGRMRLEFGSQPRDLVAAIGPGIGQCCYAVGEDVVEQFRSQFLYADHLFRDFYDPDPLKNKYPMLFLTAHPPGHGDAGLHLDLKQANRRQLLDAGLRTSAISVVADCTSCHPERYFSHRGEQGFTGRMLSVIGLRA